MAKGSFSSDWQSVVFEGRNDVVFENRNKEYGAYEIRRKYGRFLTRALLISVSAVVLTVAVPIIMNLISDGIEAINKPVDIIVDLAPPPIDKAEPPPPPPPPSPRAISQTNLTAHPHFGNFSKQAGLAPRKHFLQMARSTSTSLLPIPGLWEYTIRQYL